MKYFFTSIFSIVFFAGINAQCVEQNKTRVMLVGDSWAFFMGVDQTINTVFRNWGHSDVRYFTNSIIAENGSKTDDFQKPEKRNEILAQIAANPNIDFIHLSIGGNDVLGNWKVSFTDEQTDSLKAAVEERLYDIIDFLKGLRPNMKVLWSGYVYTNFEEVITNSILGNNHPFFGTWSGMEFPSNLQINTLLKNFSEDMEAYVANDSKVDFVNAPGLMQYTFGQENPLQIAPFGTYPPFTAPIPYGFLEFPSPRNSMRNYALTFDCFHLSPRGYEDLISYHTQKYYHKKLMNDLYILAEDGNLSGSVSSLGNVSNELLLINTAGEDFSTVITFNTKEKFDTTLSNARLFIRRQSLSGSNPTTGSLQVKVKSGAFGADFAIEPIDYTDTPDAEGTPCQFGSSTRNGHWIRLDLPAQVLPYINGNDMTQFIISALGVSNGLMRFTDASDPDFAPVLDLIYGEYPVSISEVTAKQEVSMLKVFPNPTDNILHLNTKEVINFVEIYDILGNKVALLTPVNQSIDISQLKSGTYFIKTHTTQKILTQKFIKI